VTRAVDADTRALAALVALTLAAFAAADGAGAAAAAVVLGVALAKSIVVGMQFMGLGRAHPIVRAAFVATVGAIVVAVAIARRAA
jgi:caa(3)-type oxidase subunit IV